MPISVSLAVGLQAVGIHAYTLVPRLDPSDIQAPAFPVNAMVCSTALSTHIVAMSQARHVKPVILAEGI